MNHGFLVLHAIKSHMLYFMRNLNWVLAQEPHTCIKMNSIANKEKFICGWRSLVWILLKKSNLQSYEILDDLPSREKEKLGRQFQL
jgi:hypothetical protein